MFFRDDARYLEDEADAFVTYCFMNGLKLDEGRVLVDRIKDELDAVVSEEGWVGR